MARTTAAAMLNDSLRENSQLRSSIALMQERVQEQREEAERERVIRMAHQRRIAQQMDEHHARAAADRDTIAALEAREAKRKKTSGIWMLILMALWLPYTAACVAGLASWLIPAALMLSIAVIAICGGWAG